MKDEGQTRLSPFANEILSAYVARLGPEEEFPDMECYLEVREALRGVLVGQMHRRGLWRSPPTFLGISGASWDGDALDELVSDAYVFIFVRRLRGLRNQQRLKGNIKPMVILNVRNFLTELQKKADPLGYRVFGRLRQAVEQGVERGEVFVLNDEERAGTAKKLRLKNGSVIGFQPRRTPVATRRDLTAPVCLWNNELLPKLIMAEGRAVPQVVKRLAEKVLTLKREGLAAFLLGDLAAELKDDVRRRWAAVWEVSLGDLGTEPGENGDRPVSWQVVRPVTEPDWLRRQILIQECVDSSINQQRPPRNRRDLWNLWTLIRDTRVLPNDDEGPLPSFTELGRQLELTRDRVRQLFKRLKPLVLACMRADLKAEPEESPDNPTTDSTDELQLVGRGR